MWADRAQWHFYPLHIKAGGHLQVSGTGCAYAARGTCAQHRSGFAEVGASNGAATPETSAPL